MTSHNRHEQTSCAGVSTDPCCLQSELSELLGSPNQDCVSQAECWVKKLEMTFSENYSWSDLAAQFCLWYSKKIQLSRTRLSWVWLHFSCPTRHSFQVISSKFDARGPRWSLVHLNCNLNHTLQREYFGVLFLLLVLFVLFSFRDWIRRAIATLPQWCDTNCPSPGSIAVVWNLAGLHKVRLAAHSCSRLPSLFGNSYLKRTM